jgi:hypothetical protein
MLGPEVVYLDEIERALAELIEIIRPYINVLSGFETAEEIRAFLAKEGVTGRTYESESCPVAEYLRAKSGFKVTVGYTKISACSTIPLLHLATLGVPTPAMVDFIINFDQGDYPELLVTK